LSLPGTKGAMFMPRAEKGPWRGRGKTKTIFGSCGSPSRTVLLIRPEKTSNKTDPVESTIRSRKKKRIAREKGSESASRYTSSCNIRPEEGNDEKKSVGWDRRTRKKEEKVKSVSGKTQRHSGPTYPRQNKNCAMRGQGDVWGDKAMSKKQGGKKGEKIRWAERENLIFRHFVMLEKGRVH